MLDDNTRDCLRCGHPSESHQLVIGCQRWRFQGWEQVYWNSRTEWSRVWGKCGCTTQVVPGAGVKVLV